MFGAGWSKAFHKEAMNTICSHDIERVYSIPVHCCPHEDVLEEMDQNIIGPRASLYISITNTESMYHARRIPAHREYIENARFSLCDGIGVVIGGWLEGKRVVRFNGPSLMWKACQNGVGRGWRHFFCGGREGVAELLSNNLTRQFPGMITAGFYSPPFRNLTEEEENNMIHRIRDARPDIVWIGLGLLKQEAWIAKYIAQIEVPWLIGVGAAFDYHAGTARWAPRWVRRIGMEWLYRLCHEPRMFKRDALAFLFLLETANSAIRTRLRHSLRGD
jgi:N-acetylglucosaminyldiphosphoundecaprenol N-acetyl-beta-D-mannosaminyltransferase